MKVFNHCLINVRAKSCMKLVTPNMNLTYEFPKGQSLQGVLEDLVGMYVAVGGEKAREDLIEYIKAVKVPKS